jgi:hypothetical protein
MVFQTPKHLHTKAKENYLRVGILTMASSLWLYYKVDYLILLRKRGCSLKVLTLLLVICDSDALCFFRALQLMRNTSFERHKRSLQIFSNTISS